MTTHPINMVYNHDQVDNVATRLYQLLDTCPIMTFTGPLGAGKTTLIREILKKVGIKEQVTSPTFNYVNVYKHEDKHYYHFDLYRIKSLDSFCESGFDEYLYSPKSNVFIEWPDIIMPLLDHSACHFTIDYHENENRIINVMQGLVYYP